MWLLRSNGRVGGVKWVLVGRLFFAAAPLLLLLHTPGGERGRAEAGQGKIMALLHADDTVLSHGAQEVTCLRRMHTAHWERVPAARSRLPR